MTGLCADEKLKGRVMSYLDRTFTIVEAQMIEEVFKAKIAHSFEYWSLPILLAHCFVMQKGVICYTSGEETEYSSVEKVLCGSLGKCETTGCHKVLVLMKGFPCVLYVVHLF